MDNSTAAESSIFTNKTLLLSMDFSATYLIGPNEMLSRTHSMAVNTDRAVDQIT